MDNATHRSGATLEARPARSRAELLVLNLTLLAGLGLVVPVLSLAMGTWPEAGFLLSVAVPVLAGLVWIGLGEAAWRAGCPRLGLGILGASALGLGLLAVGMLGILLTGAELVSFGALPGLLAGMMRRNPLGWLVLAGGLAGLTGLGLWLRGRARRLASAAPFILAALLLVLMLLAPGIAEFFRFLAALR